MRNNHQFVKRSEERLAPLVDREATRRENKRLVARLRFAGLRQNAVVEDIDMKAPRGLDKPLFEKLVAGEWIDRHQNLLIIVRAGLLAHWATRLAGTNARCSINGCPGCSGRSLSRGGDGRHARLLSNS
nr:ATP-binding protein [Bradyrhizobium zhanjiangense]